LRSAWAIATAAAVYGDIGRVVRERGPTAWDERAMVGTGRKLWLAGVGAWRALASRAGSKHVSRAGLWTMENPVLGS
jgi:phytoene synthase